ncbi:unnamed protein product [Adineta steineri]|uniref:G-protein coupled receptors family 1 profile domain-containing protein n=1 Tax=Adineta steineri TaxID=433720 RepID=A0A815WS59_9BILA|nr:unnamed protein product [Adineta steineri]CAF1660144.1 unnamed protein product [Adineta steineri]
MPQIINDKSIAVDCLYSNNNFTNATLFRQATINECRFARLAGCLLIIIATISFIINIWSLSAARRNHRFSRRDMGLVIGMFLSSLCVIIISVPSVVLQCFLCRRLCITFICHIEGFNSFFNGCLAMYMLVALSIVRYSTTANSSLSTNFQRQLEQRSVHILIICFILSGVWAVPPLFGRMSAYAPEGLGFHCGLDWFDRSLPGRIYFFLLFVGVFFIPIIIVIYVNVYIHRTIYRLTHLQPSIVLELQPNDDEERMRRHVSDSLYDKENRRLHRLHEDRRFVVATAISVVIYIIAWTPYSIVAVAQVFGDRFFLYNPWIMTTCAVLAKLSMITNPVIYVMILKGHDIVSHIR